MKVKSAGFTLIELMVVVFLLGALFSVAMPRVLNTQSANLRSASKGLVTTIRHLYGKAVFEKRIYKLSFDLESGRYWAEAFQGNRFLQSSDSSLGRKNLPEGVFLSDIQTERTQGKIGPDSGREAFILFLPTGVVDSSVIHLRTEKDDFVTLFTNPYTGATKILDGYVEFADILENTVQNR